MDKCNVYWYQTRKYSKAKSNLVHAQTRLDLLLCFCLLAFQNTVTLCKTTNLKSPKIGIQDQLSLNARGSILKYFWPSLSHHLPLTYLFVYLWVRFTQTLPHGTVRVIVVFPADHTHFLFLLSILYSCKIFKLFKIHDILYSIRPIQTSLGYSWKYMPHCISHLSSYQL